MKQPSRKHPAGMHVQSTEPGPERCQANHSWRVCCWQRKSRTQFWSHRQAQRCGALGHRPEAGADCRASPPLLHIGQCGHLVSTHTQLAAHLQDEGVAFSKLCSAGGYGCGCSVHTRVQGWLQAWVLAQQGTFEWSWAREDQLGACSGAVNRCVMLGCQAPAQMKCTSKHLLPAGVSGDAAPRRGLQRRRAAGAD